MTAQQRVQARQAAARQQKSGFQLRPLDLVFVLVGVIVVGFVVWSIASGQSTAPAAPGGSASASPTPLPVGSTAPDFELPGVDGKTYKLSDYKGKVVVLELFAPWCPHCQNDVPVFNEVADRYKDKPVQVLGVTASPYGKDYSQSNNTPISMDDLVFFRDQLGARIPLLLDKDMKAGTEYGVLFYPTVVMIDEEGKVASWPAGDYVWAGGEPQGTRTEALTTDGLAAEIDRILAD